MSNGEPSNAASDDHRIKVLVTGWRKFVPANLLWC